MTGPEIMAVVGFIVMLFGAITGAFWRMWGLIKEAGEKGERAQRDLADHKLHVAETYITKQGLRETTEQIMDAIHGVKQAVDHMTARVDRIVENQAKPRVTRSS